MIVPASMNCNVSVAPAPLIVFELLKFAILTLNVSAAAPPFIVPLFAPRVIVLPLAFRLIVSIPLTPVVSTAPDDVTFKVSLVPAVAVIVSALVKFAAFTFTIFVPLPSVTLSVPPLKFIVSP